ncbi:MAG: O-antigen ligase family protein [Verrucomicrobiae bacterium]|nr:O-antigen ligase family protein [Verrucomicrobiae bacterium]
MNASGAGAPSRHRSAGIALAATAFLVALAPVKFSLPAVLRHLDEWPRNFGEWIWASWPSAVFFGLLALCLLLAAWEARSGGTPLRPMLPAGLFLAAQGLSALSTQDRALSEGVMALFASLAAGFALGIVLGRDERGLRGLLVGWVAGACWVAWSGIAQANGGLEETRRYLEIHPELGAGMPELWDRVSRGRVFATFVYPNALGGYVASTVFFVAAWLAARASPPRALSQSTRNGEGADRREASALLDRASAFRRCQLGFGGLLTGALLVCLFKSQSKGGYAALVAAALVFAWVGGLRRRRATGIVLAILLLGVAGFAIGYGSRGVEKGKRTFAARVDYWRAAWRIGWEHPVFGSGPGTFAKLYPRYKAWNAESTRLVHNNYLQMWCDSGAVGFVAFAVWLPGSLVAWWWRARKTPPSTRWARTLVWAGLVAFALHSLVDFDLYLIGNAWPAFVLLGALAGAQPRKAPHVS